MAATYFVSRSKFYQSRIKAKNARSLPSWRMIAERFATALEACDWSFGRHQSSEVHEQFEAALSLMRAKKKFSKPRAGKKRR